MIAWEQLRLFDAGVVLELEAGPGEVWVLCTSCGNSMLRSRPKASWSKRCVFCAGRVEVCADGGPRPRRAKKKAPQTEA